MKSFRNILVHVDTRTDVNPLLDRATELAKSHSAGLTLIDIIPELPWSLLPSRINLEEMRRTIVEQKTRAVEALVSETRQRGVTVQGKVLTGRTSLEIISEVTRENYDLVIKAAKGPESKRFGFLGTTATRLLRFCPCAVWAFRSVAVPGERRVVAAVDAEPADERHRKLNGEIIELAYALEKRTPHILYVWSIYGEKLIKDYIRREELQALVADGEQRAREKLGELLAPYGISVDGPYVHLLRGSENEEIPRFVNEGNYDALVIGTVGRSGISGLLVGNTAEVLIDRVNCSLIAVKPVEHVSLRNELTEPKS